jgi:hypothetical protein
LEFDALGEAIQAVRIYRAKRGVDASHAAGVALLRVE